MLIIAGHNEVDRDEALAVVREQVTRARDAPGRLDLAITAEFGAARSDRTTANPTRKDPKPQN